MVSAVLSGGFRAVARCDALGAVPYSDMADGLYRAYLTPAYAAAQDALAGWMEDAGMQVRCDAAANLVGRYEGTDPAAPALLIGSHLDSVRDGGRYDGPLGIMLGVEAVAALHAQGRRLPFPIEVYAFGDEEGSRFPAAMLTSRAVAGTLEASALAIADGQGVALAEAGVDVSAYLTAARLPGTTRAYLEAHIEQGPVLEAEGLALGIVTGIAAQLRFRITLDGKAGHAGTTSMRLRRDALAAAAEIVLAAERTAKDGSEDLVATVGTIEARPGAANVIPGKVTLSLDVRALDPAVRDRAANAIIAQAHEIAAHRDIGFASELVHDLPASPCDPQLMDLLDAAMRAKGHAPRRLASGAGHDAMVMAALCPTAMLFIRCAGGVSHNPAEHVTGEDADAALQVMLGFIDRLGDAIDHA